MKVGPVALACEQVQEIGLCVARRRPDTDHLYGWALFTRGLVQEAGLAIQPDHACDRHVNIAGWLSNRSDCIKIQQLLAEKSVGCRLCEPIAA